MSLAMQGGAESQQCQGHCSYPGSCQVRIVKIVTVEIPLGGLQVWFPPPKFNSSPLKNTPWNIIVEVWKIIFLSKWVICMFQPLIFQGVMVGSWKPSYLGPLGNFSGVNSLLNFGVWSVLVVRSGHPFHNPWNSGKLVYLQC